MTAGATPALVRAAGCLLWREGADGIEIGLVHRQRHDDWSLPKGKLERSESWPGAAVREVREETGRSVVLGPPLPTQHYVVDGAPKEVRYWAAEASAVGTPEVFEATDEVDRIDWLAVDEARDRLSYPHDAGVLDAFLRLAETIDGAQADVLVVLRHARAMKRAHWRGPDDDRPLEDRGLVEAEALAHVLAAYGLDDVRSSGTRRCLDTVEPYALAHHLPVAIEPHVSERGHRHKPDAAGRRMTRLLEAGGRVVLCSHRPVLPALLSAAVGADDAHALIGSGLPPSAMVVIHHLRGRVLATERHDP